MTDSLVIFGNTFDDVTGIKATDDNDNTLIYIRPTGTKSISSNGTGIDVTEYASVDVNVSGGGGTTEVTIATDGAVTQELQPDTFYHFTSSALTSLTITFGGNATDQYHFDFISPATAITLTLPASVSMETPFSVEVNTKYEIDIYNNYGVFAEWAYGS